MVRSTKLPSLVEGGVAAASADGVVRSTKVLMINTNPARGTRDFLPADVRKREYVIGIIKEVYESYGFEPLETPSFENLETLTGKYGEEGNQLIFRILKRGDALKEGAAIKDLSDLALRYDLTVPLARVVAHHKNDLPKYFKRYQIQPVWRADRPARGRYREFYQCDVDAIGSNSMLVEAELISAVSDILNKLGFDDFVIRINHREILETLLIVFGVALEDRAKVLIILDKLDKIGEFGVTQELAKDGIPLHAINGFFNVVNQLKSETDGATAIRRINAFFEDFEEKSIGTDKLRSLFALLGNLGTNRVKVDLSLARGLSYYTGTIMEINVPDLTGSLGGGGRYDGLIGMFGKEQIPACGFSLGLERILVVMEEREMFPSHIAASTSADVMVMVFEVSIEQSLTLAKELRQNDLRVLIYPNEADGIGKQFKYANQINVRYICIIGDDELAENKVTVKNMVTGEQETVPSEDVASIIQAGTDRK